MGELAAQLREVRAAMAALGYEHQNAVMSFATLALPVSPAVTLTDKGIVTVADQQIVPFLSR